ncbi:MAG: glucose-6-phosphate dehydrogenase [Nitrospirae bacterium]|nr:glucose-6-phosphate dehydrogenase [Nitrospirota bacterium]
MNNGPAYATYDSCSIEIPRPFLLVIFGASGDLSRKKLFPALYRLDRDGLLPRNSCILGTARTAMDQNSFREQIRQAVEQAMGKDFDRKAWDVFSARLYYHAGAYDDPASYSIMRAVITGLEQAHDTLANRIFYLAVPPTVYELIITNLGISGLSKEDGGFTHVAVEKPIGSDLDSARKLNAVLRTSFLERQIYRMDHYLAKETVQNILMFRFANAIFEPLWNRRYIDHVQITVAESIGIENRAGYYEKAGILRDMFQNHIFQLLALTAMEPPALFEAERVRDERVKVFRSIRPLSVSGLRDSLVLGQYGSGSINGTAVNAYRQEKGVSPDSQTPTYAALKVYIDNWRWNGVPFYLRSGKRLSGKKAEISIHYRAVPHLMFAQALKEKIEPNTLVIRIQPDEGIDITFQAKNPGTKICLSPVNMDFSYPRFVALSDYERILLDCMQGDQMLFVRDDSVEETWALLNPVFEEFESGRSALLLQPYTSGTEGPAEATELLRKDGRAWRPL